MQLTCKHFIITCFCCLLTFCSACSLASYNRFYSFGKRPVYHRVSSGETLYQISQRYGVSVRDLALRNGVRDPRELMVGQRLLVAYSYGGSRVSERHRRGIFGYDSGNEKFTIGNGRLSWPVPGGRLVSRFGRRWTSYHDGIDIAANGGTPVYAAHTARVVYSGNGLSGYGNLLILRDSTGLLTVYAHNRRLLVDKGKLVRRGQVIAEVGSTGRASGPHLHFEVRARSSSSANYISVDPLVYFGNSKVKSPEYRRNNSLNPILAKASW